MAGDVKTDLLTEELRGLAIELHRRHYSHVPQWKVSSDPRGALSQIENMTAGMADQIDRLRAAISWVEPPFVDSQTSCEELRNRVRLLVTDAKRADDAPTLVHPTLEMEGGNCE